jgi:hypothetical protein
MIASGVDGRVVGGCRDPRVCAAIAIGWIDAVHHRGREIGESRDMGAPGGLRILTEPRPPAAQAHIVIHGHDVTDVSTVILRFLRRDARNRPFGPGTKTLPAHTRDAVG